MQQLVDLAEVSQQKSSSSGTSPTASTTMLRLDFRENHEPCSDWRTSTMTRPRSDRRSARCT
ncbi:hypothetical protein [Streptomyces sp. KL116D]|uniref:hypothetical protein n=1 Tax=Streptomyces sp. KL116D TaxID=3045152 RepID=UPI003557F341